jgi:hypothetical protein
MILCCITSERHKNVLENSCLHVFIVQDDGPTTFTLCYKEIYHDYYVSQTITFLCRKKIFVLWIAFNVTMKVKVLQFKRNDIKYKSSDDMTTKMFSLFVCLLYLNLASNLIIRPQYNENSGILLFIKAEQNRTVILS